jgi:uncharacterized phage infection (PIP) family protein YhgE
MAKPLPAIDPIFQSAATPVQTANMAHGEDPSRVNQGSDDAIDFETPNETNGFLPDLGASTPRTDDVESLIQRYHAERQGLNRRGAIRKPATAEKTVGQQDTRSLRDSAASTGHGGLTPAGRRIGVSDLDQLRAENQELREMVTELKQVLEANDPQVWEQLNQEQLQLLAVRDQEITALKSACDEWNRKLQTCRFVPADDELAQISDELEKERCQVNQERRQLEDGKRQLKEDEDALMKQMREMEVAMARDRAELARQRMDLQRMQNDVQHELELLQRGDVAVKERLAQFQRRTNDTPARGLGSVAPAAPEKSKDSATFKRLFGNGS